MTTLTVLLTLLILGRSETIRIEHDNVDIKASGQVVIPVEFVADADQSGVIHVATDGVVLDFAGQTLNGARADLAPDQFDGIGLRITAKQVTIRNARIRGYKVGIWASGADNLVIEDCDVSGNWRQRLKSTPQAEDGSDWLWPHNNDKNEWMTSYGAAIYVEDSANITVRRCTARRGQNGLLLDRVRNSKVYDNDFSFLSAWGLGMWRSTGNVISRNAFDFCVRGYSHGVYNRGQDSAGILFFEQNDDNVIAENSATHGGDGFFGFGGREALGEIPPPSDDFDYTGRGNRRNVLVANDFSYAPAHGIELTFSFDNRIQGNRLVGNAICGIWGGYSQRTLIVENTFEGNGEAGYGLERGGVNIEHGRENVIVNNQFLFNACGVHLWWDADESLLKSAWGKANRPDCDGNTIAGNRFEGDRLAIHLRDCTGTRIVGNTFTDVAKQIEASGGSPPLNDGAAPAPPPRIPELKILGDKRPVGARPQLRGRDKIIITEWGPYDWEAPYLHFIGPSRAGDFYRLLGKDPLAEARATGNVDVRVDRSGPEPRITVAPNVRGALVPYSLEVRAGDKDIRAGGVLIAADWTVRVFPNTVDPREDEAGWKRESTAGSQFTWPGALMLNYGGGGASQIANMDADVVAAKLPGDHFSTIATMRITFPAGRWRLRTASDDGIRVYVDDKLVIDDWTWHPPKTHAANVEYAAPTTVMIRVEHFELDGYAVLSLDIEPDAASP